MKYAGIGSRETPHEVLGQIEYIAQNLAEEGHTLRSGGAKGADLAFEEGCGDGKSEIFRAEDCTPEAMELSAKFHPNWDACKQYARKLHGRNALIILGRDLNDPVDIVICWTKDGKLQGGTAQALRIAAAYDIPVYNLGAPDPNE